ncbi:hypothetical protein [Nocardia seriolae]|uniref:hypothetical protein n=1 Tax=Nocardia seriolae TaxID=37332 RepID=UPI00090A3B03|nr:hypothetical protein [Nocardia seriolae]MTJ63766.1 hypothetical protein [Nocardia seriolae]MTJ74007.1 hypothetical protein [Nocardia seriolae]MTJ88330.1 hypothetical protein [Nocardia seriolae]MTK32315.1 hypothetical protein [Nocardia seriolae]MTK41654.1 hypothetical protein [Nocardia seriolae]
MASERPFGMDPEELERILREAGIELGDLLGKVGEYIDRASLATTLTSLLGQFVQPERTRAPKPEAQTTGETGSGVWVIYTVDDTGGARVEQVFPTELEALRAHRDNTDERRRVRFLPYGVPATALDTP